MDAQDRMTVQGGGGQFSPAGVVMLREADGWASCEVPGGRAWFKGYVFADGELREGAVAALSLAASLPGPDDSSALAEALRDVDGQYGFAVQRGGEVLAVADRTRSIPLAWGRGPRGWVLDSRARALAAAIAPCDPDSQAGLELAMSGYTLGQDTLLAQVRQLQAGEAVVLAGDQARPLRYYLYRAWDPEDALSPERWVEELEAVTRGVADKLVRSLDGRRAMVPLSAGLDSRLVASGLKQAGYDNVQLYAYGIPGNYEAAASRDLAERLGYSWTFIPYSRHAARDLALSREFGAYLDFADTLSNLPFVQDFLAVRQLRDSRMAPPDAVFVNGNSGDFISGGHIQPRMHEPRPGLARDAQRDLVVETALDKHFDIWRDLGIPANRERVGARLAAMFEARAPQGLRPEGLHGVYECLEWESRQSKFVVGGQRVYEHLGFAWRLPLWDNDYLDFWARVPLAEKVGQGLYRRFLQAADWGGVWRNFPVRRYTSPAWARVARGALRLALRPLGEAAWKTLDRRLFTYFTDILCTHAMVPVSWAELALDRRGFRHSMAWRCAAYLRDRGLGPDGAPVGGKP
ncbi:MAG: asparagine synthase C-terminal domain-containing protein [Thermodesulfobacteriota bacterium]